jgi:hypothetical protein
MSKMTTMRHQQLPKKNTPNKTFSSSSSRSKTDRQRFKDGGDDSTTPIGNCGDIFHDEIEAQAFFLA